MLAPTMLTTFLGCLVALAWDLQVVQGSRKPPRDRERDPLAEKVLEHERLCLETLGNRHGEVVKIDEKGVFSERHAATLRAMEVGAPVIWRAALSFGPWADCADFLVRLDEPSKRWAWAYEPWAAKLSHIPMPSHVLQLCLQADMLAAIQGSAPRHGHLMLGGVATGDDTALLNGSDRYTVFRLDDFRHYSSRAARRFEAFVVGPQPDLSPEPCAACGSCHWLDACERHWRACDHLCRVADITKVQMRHLTTSSVTTMAELAGLASDRGPSRSVRVPGISAGVLASLSQQAQLQKRSEELHTIIYELLPPEPGRGLHRLPPPDPGDLYFGFEGDPLHPGGLEYLCGVLWQDGNDTRSHAFWAHDRAQEKHAFKALMAFLRGHFQEHPRAHLYHYGPYEKAALRRLASMHAVCEDQMDELLRRNVMVDLHRTVRETLRVGEESYSIRRLRRLYMEPNRLEMDHRR